MRLPKPARQFCQEINNHLQTTTKALIETLDQAEMKVSWSTIEKILQRNFHGCRIWKIPLLRKQHLQVCLPFARGHPKQDSRSWSTVLWCDETKLLFGCMDVECIWRKKGDAQKPKNTVLTMKDGSGNIEMLLIQWQKEPCQGVRNDEKRGLHQDT